MLTREIKSDGSTKQNIEDSLTVRTSKVNSNITVTKMGVNKIYFNFKMDSNYTFDSATVALYVDGKKTDSMPVNIEQSTKSNGWSSSFSYNYGSEIILKIENVIYNGSKIDVDIQAKIKNY